MVCLCFRLHLTTLSVSWVKSTVDRERSYHVEFWTSKTKTCFSAAFWTRAISTCAASLAPANALVCLNSSCVRSRISCIWRKTPCSPSMFRLVESAFCGFTYTILYALAHYNQTFKKALFNAVKLRNYWEIYLINSIKLQHFRSNLVVKSLCHDRFPWL